MNERITELLEEIMSEYKTMDPFKVIEMKGIELEYSPFKSQNRSLGLYMKSFDTPTIYLKADLEDSPEKYFVAAHELHHALEHDDVSSYYTLNHLSRSKMEQEANKFAAAMCFNLYIEEQGKLPETTVDLLNEYGVPLELSEILL